MIRKLLFLFACVLTTVGAWATDDVVLDFGTESTWTINYSGGSEVTGVTIYVATEGDLASIQSSINWNTAYPAPVYSLDNIKQKNLVVTGSLNTADVGTLTYAGDPLWNGFCQATTMSIADATISDDGIEAIKTAWNNQHNGDYSGLILPTNGENPGGEEPGGEEPGGEDPTNNFGSASSWSYADGTLTINLNASSDLLDSNWEWGQSCPWASEIGSISKVVLKPAADVELNSNVLYIFFENKPASTLDLSNLTAEQVDQLKSSQNLDKIYNNRSKISLKLPEGYEYDSAAEPWSHYTVTGGTNTNGSGGGSGSGGGDPEPGPAPAVVTTGHVTYTTTLAANDVATINLAACGGDCTHTTLAGILSDASISTDDAFAKVIINGAATSDFEAQLVNLNTKALVLADVTGLTVSTSLVNSYVKNLVLPNGLHKDVVTAENLAGFTNLESAASVESLSETKTTDHYYYTPNGGSKTEFTGVVVDKGEGVYEGTVTEHPTVQLNDETVVSTYVNNYYKDEVTVIADDATPESDVYIEGGVAKVNRQKVSLSGTKKYYSNAEYTSELGSWQINTETEEGENQGKPYYWDKVEGVDVKNFNVYVKWEYNYQSKETWQNVIYDGEEPTTDGDMFVGYLEYDPAKEYTLTTKYNYTYKFDPTDESEEAKPISFNESKTVAQVNRDVTYTLTKESVDVPVDLGKSLVAYVKEAGTLYATLMHMSALNSRWDGFDTRAMNPYFGTEHGSYAYDITNVKYVTLAGNLKATDINGGSAVIDPTTHHYVPMGTAGAVSYGALAFGTKALVSLDLENAVFEEEYYKDLTISAYGIFRNEPQKGDLDYEQFVVLPTSPSMTIIPTGCLQNKRGIKELCIPYNYTVVEADAFKDTGISHIYTTSPLTQDVEGVHYEKGDKLDLGPTCWTLPPFLTRIETGAFWTNVTHGVTDVYIYNPVAPVCQKDAFPKGMYTGWGGFEGNDAHPINRNTYHNGDDLFTILHFPSGLTDAARGKYTDITRKYSFMDETGATDDDGNVFYWPAMNQFYRAYDQAVAGVTWDAWIASHDPNDYTGETGWDPAVTYDDFSTARTSTESKLNNAYGTTYDNLSRDVQYDYENYMGWHQFVLVGSMNYQKTTGEEKYWNFSKYKEQDWYTLCVPFDMTKADLLRIFGDPTTERYPKVVTLAGVDRNKNTQHIQIRLSEDLITKKLNVDANGLVEVAKAGTGKYEAQYTDRPDDDSEKIIEANKPYFILPCIPKDQVDIANAGNRALEYKPLEDDKTAQTPYLYHHVNAFNGDRTKFIDWQDKEYDAAPGQPYKYYFVGTYLEQIMPKYAYYLGVKGGKSTVFRNTKDTKLWSSFTTIIGAVASSNASIVLGGGGVSDGQATNFRVVFTAEEDFTFNNALPSQAKAMGFTYAFDEGDNTSTGIMVPNNDGSMTFVPSNSKVYNVNGQYVGNSVENLSKGIYVVNGKKFIVR